MNDISLYIHWPFCLSKCPYCDFNSHLANAVNHDVWLESYKQEISYFTNIIKGKYVKSVFFGGGTPSLMKPLVVSGIIEKIASIAMIDNQTEITLEANPTSFEAAKFEDFKIAGINRVSIGVQALREHDLKKLGREHDTIQAKQAIETAAKLFSKISFDLIYARSGQTLKDWQEELQEAMQLANGHISLYQLTIEKGTPFYKLFRNGSFTLPDNDLAADMYEWTNSYLQSHGYNRYEISNYAMTEHECKHNLAYWHYDNYLGIGPGAHSRVATPNLKAITMQHQPEKWLKSINELGHGIQIINDLTKEEIITEFFMMGMRLKNGLNISKLKQIASIDPKNVINYDIAKHYTDLGLLDWQDQNIKLTSKGLMLHSYIVPRLLKSICKS